MNAKRILMLAWEYPPNIEGGLARVVKAVAGELVALDCEVHVITADYQDSHEFEVDECGVNVHRVKTQTDMHGLLWESPNFLTKISRLNVGMLQYAIKLHLEKPFDIVHAHDWLVNDAAWVLKSFGLPLISTIHATEFGRSKGIHNSDNKYINECEWRLLFESKKAIVNSRHMLDELQSHFHVPAEKVVVIPNGMDLDKFKCDDGAEELRVKYGVGKGPVILFVGRLVAEKGVQVLLGATPTVLQQYPNSTVIIAGDGFYRKTLEAQANALGLGKRVRFFGRANDDDLCELFKIASVAVVPSTYEPFGLVALEAMVAGVPLVSSDNGGLKDIVEHTVNGITTYAGDPRSLAWGIQEVLGNPELRVRMTAAARQKVIDQFSWPAIAQRTLAAYNEVLALQEAERHQEAAAHFKKLAAAPVDATTRATATPVSELGGVSEGRVGPRVQSIH